MSFSKITIFHVRDNSEYLYVHDENQMYIKSIDVIGESYHRCMTPKCKTTVLRNKTECHKNKLIEHNHKESNEAQYLRLKKRTLYIRTIKKILLEGNRILSFPSAMQHALNIRMDKHDKNLARKWKQHIQTEDKQGNMGMEICIEKVNIIPIEKIILKKQTHKNGELNQNNSCSK